jgi:hypothetical protein
MKADRGELGPYIYKLQAWKTIPIVSRHSVESKNYNAIFSHTPARLLSIAYNKIGIEILLNLQLHKRCFSLFNYLNFRNFL